MVRIKYFLPINLREQFVKGDLFKYFIHIPCAISIPFFLHWTDFPRFPPLLYQS